MKTNFSFFFIFLFPFFANAQDSALTRFKQIRSSSELRSQLKEIVEVAIQKAFGDQTGGNPASKNDLKFRDPLPLFVTAKKGDRVRGCMGSLEAKTGSLPEEIEKNLKLAFTRDPRHPPVERAEIPGMEIFITVVGSPVAVREWDSLSPARDGILIRSGMKEAVVLPGEAKTTRYLLAFAKSKAGIKRGESFQLYRLPSLTLSLVLGDGIFSPGPKPGAKAESSPRSPASTAPATP